MKLRIRPITLKAANEYVSQFHRHNKATVGHKFSVSCWDEDSGRMVGVAIAGRPVSRVLDDGETLEILRVCTDGTRNVNSMLYGACSRCARAMGYRKVVTYTLETESGASLKAAGFKNCGWAGGGVWDTPSRRRDVLAADGGAKYPTQKKIRWEKWFI